MTPRDGASPRVKAWACRTEVRKPGRSAYAEYETFRRRIKSALEEENKSRLRQPHEGPAPASHATHLPGSPHAPARSTRLNPGTAPHCSPQRATVHRETSAARTSGSFGTARGSHPC